MTEKNSVYTCGILRLCCELLLLCGTGSVRNHLFLMITLTKTYKFKVKNFLLLALEVIIGFLATAFILLPSVLGLMGNPRLAELPNGWDSLVYSQPQKYWLIILSLFSPQICLRSLCSHPAQIADGRLLRHGCRLSE